MKTDTWDVCVVGSGASGGVLASTLVNAGLRVVTVEQGDAPARNQFDKPDPERQKAFNLPAEVSFPVDAHAYAFQNKLYAPPELLSSHPREGTDFRQFQIFALDGLTSLWNGVALRFAPDDFRQWPIGYADLEPYYLEAERLIRVCGSREGLETLPDGEFLPPKELRPPDVLFRRAAQKLGERDLRVIPNRKAVETRPDRPDSCQDTGGCLDGCPHKAMYKFSTRLLPELQASGRHELLLRRKAVRLLCSGSVNEITGLEVLHVPSGRTETIRARTYVLAAGALETPRILFNSTSGESRQGLANSSGHLGRGLQDNPKVLLSTSLWRLWGSRRRYSKGFGDHLLVLARPRTAAGESFRCIGQLVHQLPEVPLYLPYLRKCPTRLKPWLARQLYRSYVTLAFFAPAERCESNRLEPSGKCDAYGVPQVRVVYGESPGEQAMRQTMAGLGRRLLKKASATRIVCEQAQAGLGIHYAGTARMALAPDLGVVDADLRTFDHPNMYICDGSVIPALPEKHLTLTLMALACRLGRHVAGIHRHSYLKGQ